MGIINLEENEKNIRSLTNYRPLGTVPVAGRYRLIDFIMSSMVNAGIKHVSVFTNKVTRSLPDHLGSGKPWDLDRKNDGLFIFSHNLFGVGLDKDAKSFGNHMDFLNRANCDKVIIASSNMVCNIDLDAAGTFFEESDADIVMVYKHINSGESEFINCDTLKIDETGKVISVAKNVGVDDVLDISMGIFVMRKKLLIELMYKAVSEGSTNNFKHYLLRNMNGYVVKGYEFKGYLQCVNSIDSYYKTNMDMLDLKVIAELFNKNSPVYTKIKDAPPVQYVKGSKVKHAIVADGTVVKGEVKNSVVSRFVTIEEGVKLDGCIILQNAVIKKGANLTNVIIDKGVTVDENVVVQCPKQYPLVFEKKKYLV